MIEILMNYLIIKKLNSFVKDVKYLSRDANSLTEYFEALFANIKFSRLLHLQDCRC